MSGHDDDIANSGGPGSSSGEPSMQEILAAIRRTLKESEPGAPLELEDEVLVLDASMIAKPADLASGTAMPAAAETAGSWQQAGHIASEPALTTRPDAAAGETGEPPFIPPATPVPDEVLARPDEAMYSLPDQSEPAMSENIEPPESLVGEEARDATKSSIGALVRSIGAERSVQVSRGGITIEDIVREELRPMLKSWLDSHLPTLVERIVRAEIERVVDRTQA